MKFRSTLPRFFAASFAFLLAAQAHAASSLVFQRGYVDEQYGFGGSLYLVDPTTSDAAYFFGGGNHPNYSPDGSQIVFVDTDGDLTKTPANNYTPTNLVIAGGGSKLGGLKPKWSPDATLIAFATQATNANKIVITNAACTSGDEYNSAVCNYTKLDQSSTAVNSDPDWFPAIATNGATRIASLIFVRKATSNATSNDIYSTEITIDANGVVHEVQTTNLTQSLSIYEAPRYSHDGTKIIFVQGGSLHLMDSDGTNQHPIVSSTDSGLIFGYDPAFSEDDSKIVWGSGSLYSADLVVNQNGSVSANNIKQLTNSSSDRSPSWIGNAGETPGLSLPLTRGASNKLDLGAFAGNTTVTLTFTGSGDLIGSNWRVKPDGSLASVAGAPYDFANPGAAYSTQNGGDGINHFTGGGANFDSTGSGYGFAGKQTTDTTDPNAIRLGAIVGTFSSNPGREDWFYIGSGTTVQTPPAGAHLYVAVNDTNQSDNHGAYSGTLTTGNPMPPTPPAHGGLSATTFTVDESSTPSANLNDSVLRFHAVQTGTPAGLLVRVQANTGSGWSYLSDGLQGQMAYAPQVTGFILHSTNYPTANSVSFRAIATAPGYPDSVSNVVGPFNLTQNRPHLGPTILFVTTNGEINAIRFGVNETTVPDGTFIRVQSTQTPALEDSWSDVTINGSVLMSQDASDVHQFYSGTDNYPDSDGNYFRAVASNPNGGGYVNSISIPYGPFKFVSDPPAKVTIKLNGETIAPNDIDNGQLIPAGTFNVQATATSGRFIKRLALLLDGSLIKDFGDGTANGAVDFTTRIAGDHLVEAYATDDLGVTGAAVPIHIRILPASPGKVFMMQNSGDWNQASNWIDIEGHAGVPGPNDFAIVSTFSPTLSTDVTVGAMSLNGGTLNGAHTLTVSGFCTIADGAIKSNLTIPAGATCELLNDTDITLTGTFTYAGNVRLHGKGGIGGVNTNSNRNLAGPHPDGFFDFVGGIIHGVGQFFVDLAAGGKRGSKATPAPAPAPAAPEKRAIKAAQVQIPAGKVTVVQPPAVAAGLIAAGGGNLIASGGGNLIAAGGGNLVAAGGGNLVAAGGGNLIGQDGTGLIAAGGGNLIATGGGNLIGQDGTGLVASGGGNLIASGGGNRPTGLRLTNAADASSVAVALSGGELDLTDLTIYGSVAMTNGVLSGSGIILGDLTNDGGFITPGHSAGVVLVTGSFAQGANGALIVENGGATPDKFDQLLVSGAANLGGKLIVHTINGYTPDPANTFSPLGYSSVSGNFGSTSSNAGLTLTANGALLTTNPNIPSPVDATLRNISTRARVQTGDNVLIGGFIVTGSTSKKVIVRALGPSLPVNGALADPVLELHKSDGTVVTNDNWRTSQEQEIIGSGLAPRSDLDSAIIATLPPGGHTIVVRGKGSATGVGLVEVYEMDSSATATLANISTRCRVQTGDDVMIGGVIVGGTEPASVLVRALGPSLTSAGLSDLLQDPMLELYDANGNVITNDDWRETQENEIIALALAPSDPKEPAILAALVPGNYTAIVRGKDNTTGIALVEAFKVK